MSAIIKEKGGIVKVKTIGDIHRNCRQVCNINRRQGDDGDALLSVMAMCNQSMDKDDVQIVTSALEPIRILCSDQQLNDIEQFCTDPACFVPLSVDPTLTWVILV